MKKINYKMKDLRAHMRMILMRSCKKKIVVMN